MADYTEFSIGQGETFKLLTQICDGVSTPVDITSASFSGQIRDTYQSDTVSAAFDFDKVSPYSSGSLYIHLSASVTATLGDRSYVYDVYYTSESYTRRILEGKFIVRPAATK
jgi:hypothetical protein